MSFAFVFPGQGSQSLKMMDGLLEFSTTHEVFKIAQEVLGIDFLAMLQQENPQSINETINTQPLMLCAGFATYLAWQAHSKLKPTVMAGHSLGEWTALVASGVMKFTDALLLVKLRAQVMQEAVPVGQGAMAAVLGMEDAKLIAICQQVMQESSGVVSGANFNSPGQVVIAGDKISVDKASIKLKEQGAKRVQILPVSVPSHCGLMFEASQKVAQALKEVKFNLPQIPVLQNYAAASYDNIVAIKDALVKQIYSPVLWTNTIESIVAQGTNHIVECGPGKVLSGLNKRINSSIISYCLHQKADFILASNALT